MITKISSLKELPYKSFEGFVLKNESDTAFIGDKQGYLFVTEHPKSIVLFVEASENLLASRIVNENI